MTINSINLIGRLGGDPTVRYFETGKVLAEFSLAINRPNAKKETDWFSCAAWGKTAELIANHCKKGGQIAVEGRLEQDEWTSKEGLQRIKIKVVVDRITFIKGGEKKEEAESEEPSF